MLKSILAACAALALCVVLTGCASTKGATWKTERPTYSNP